MGQIQTSNSESKRSMNTLGEAMGEPDFFALVGEEHSANTSTTFSIGERVLIDHAWVPQSPRSSHLTMMHQMLTVWWWMKTHTVMSTTQSIT
jgi:hypothetical protein